MIALETALLPPIKPSLDFPLKNTLVPTKRTGSATFTRATTGTIRDQEGLFKTVKSGEARFEGARREANELQKTENFEDAIWLKRIGVSVTDNFALAPDGTMTACKYLPTTQFGALGQSATIGTKSISFWGRVVSGTRRYDFYSNGGVFYGYITLDTTWRRYSLNFTSTETSAYYLFQDRASSGFVETHLWHPMLADVTGRSNQNPPEYVSNGAIRRNLLIRSNEFNNATWATSNITITANNGTPTINGYNFATLGEGTANGGHYLYSTGTTVSYTNGATYTLQILAKANTATVIQLAHSLTIFGAEAYGNFDLVNGVVGTKGTATTSSIVSVGNGWYLCSITAPATLTATGSSAFVMVNNNTSAVRVPIYTGASLSLYIACSQTEWGGIATIYQNITDASAIDFNNYHGAGVDGVKCFITENGNTVSSNIVTEATGSAIPEATLRGIREEVASTNLLTYSQDYTNVSWQKPGTTITAGVIAGLDGAMTGCSLIENSGALTGFGMYHASITGTLTTLTYYIKAKSNDRWVRVSPGRSGTDFFYITVNPATGEITQTARKSSTGTATGISGYTEMLTGQNAGVCKVVITGTWGVSGIIYPNIFLADTSTPVEGTDYGYVPYTGNGTSGIYALGTQIEILPFSSSYIPTTTATVTRNADVPTFPNAGNVSDTQGTVLMDVTPAFDIPNSATAGNGFNQVLDFGSNAGVAYYTGKVDGYDGTNIILSPSWSPLKNTTYKIGYRYGSAGQKNWLNGTAGTNGAFDGSINSGTNMTIGGKAINATYNWG